MGFMAMAMLAFGLTTCFTCTADSAPCPSGTVVINITSTADVHHLTEALSCVGQGVFNITWHSSLTVDEEIEVADEKHMTVTGDALGDDNAVGVIVDAGSGTGIFSVSDGSTLRLNNIGLEGGNAEDGAAVAVDSSSTLFVFGCTFTRNDASYGGALFSYNSSIYVDGSTTFEDNSAQYGGVIYAILSKVFIDGNALFKNNTAGEDGGVVYASFSAVSLHGNTEFSSNHAGDRGGVIYAASSELGIDGDAMFTDNSAVANGGVIYARSSEVGVDGNASFTNNSVQELGGSVYAESSNVTFHGNTDFCSNYASEQGGTIYARLSEMLIDGNANFTSNSASEDGGAIYVTYSNVEIGGNVSFTQNSAGATGGVVFADYSQVSLYGNILFSGSYSGDLAGVIYGWYTGISIGGNTSFENNSARSAGGVVLAVASNVSLNGNTHFSSNHAGSVGGVIHVSSSQVHIDGDASFRNNSAEKRGGAIYAFRTVIGIDGNANFTDNSAWTDGGAIYAKIALLGIDGGAIFTNNSAVRDGGERGRPLCIAWHKVQVTTTISGNLFLEGSNGVVNYDKNQAKHGSMEMASFWALSRLTDPVTFSSSTFEHSLGLIGLDKSHPCIASILAGAIRALNVNVTVIGTKNLRGHVAGNEGGLISEAGGDDTSDWSVAFVSNSAGGLGGAILFEMCEYVEVRAVLFKSNEASLGGAIYVLAEDNTQTFFSECVLEGNTAEDGGAVYMNTGPGVDIFTASVFSSNFAGTSGGAIFHTGTMRVVNTSFVANMAGVEGPGVMSVGYLKELSNVVFTENTYFCGVGQYGFIDKTQDGFDEVCSRCSTFGGVVSIHRKVRVDGKPACAEPPVGAIARIPGTTVANLTLQRGYFRTSNESRDIRQCYQTSACQGGNDIDKYCAFGYTGPYCAVCANEYAPGIAYSCRECSGYITRLAVALAVVVGLVVLLISGVLLSSLGKVVNDGAEEGVEIDQSLWKIKCTSYRAFMVNILPVRAIKIAVTVWQIISQFDAISGGVYPELYQTFVSNLNLVNLDFDFVFSYSCLVSNDFYDHLVFVTSAPLLVLVVLAGSYFVGKRRNSCSETAVREVRHKHQAAVVFVAFLVYSPVSYQIFQTFGCDQLDDGETYLRADYSLSCSTARHSWYKGYAFIMVAVYPIGISAAFAGFLVWHRQDLVKPDRVTMLHLKPLNGVWAAYKPSRYYYEIVECGRRIALTVIAAFVPPNSTAQASMALLFAVVYVFISEVLSPFENGIDMGLYRWGNGIIVASMYVAFLTKIDVDQDTASTEYLLTFSGVLIAANMFMVITVLIQTVLLAKEMQERKNSVTVSDIPLRRTESVSLRDLRPVNEDGVYTEGGNPLESKDSEDEGAEWET